MKTFLFYGIILCIISGCGKEFLDVKRDSNQVVPHTIDDYMAVLDNSTTMGWSNFGLGMLSEDDFKLDTLFLKSLSGANVYQRNAYIWADDVYEGNEVRDWNNTYQRIMVANLALDVENLTLTTGSNNTWNAVRGTARFHRAWNYYQLVQLFCKTYDSTTSSSDPGVPLRLEYDVTMDIGRGSVQLVYDQIIDDLLIAKEDLPIMTSTKFRPNRAAAHALLARVYLLMADYTNALSEAQACLDLSSGLLDFNLLDFTNEFTFQDQLYGEGNPEVLFCTQLFTVSAFNWSRVNMDEQLLSTYGQGDLRKSAYFKEEENGRTWFKGSLSGVSQYFMGLALDEMYLIKAECLARLGDVDNALVTINDLRVKRFDRSMYTPALVGEIGSLLGFILDERRKSLVFRGIRWSDLRRLNLEGLFSTRLRRELDGTEWVLEPNTARWVWPLPYNEAALYPQNPR